MPVSTREASLDTNAYRAWIANDSALSAVVANRGIVIPAIVVSEVLSGWLLLMDQHQRKQDELRFSQALIQLVQVVDYLKTVRILNYGSTAQAVYELRKGRGNRGRNDLRIAATCVAHEVPLITRNVRDFEDIPDLQMESW